MGAGLRGLAGLAALGENVAELGLAEGNVEAPAEGAGGGEEPTPAGPAGSSPAEVGARIRAARTAAGLTGQELGAAIGLTKDKISKIETGRRRVDVSELAGIAAATRTTVRVLLGQPEAEHVGPLAMAARLAPGADVDSDRQMRSTARQLLGFDDLLGRVAQMPPAKPSSAGAAVARLAADRDRFPERPRNVQAAIRQGRELAGEFRDLLDLGTDAIGDLSALIEFHFAADVALAPYGTDADGLCVHSRDRALLLASSSYVAGHVRFTLAHELGHHLFGDPREIIAEGAHDMFDSVDTIERRVNAFAGYLLMPEAGIRQTLTWSGHTDGAAISRRHVAALMEHFDVSRQALLYQLRLMRLLTWDQSRALEEVPVWRMLADNVDVAPTGRANAVYPIVRSPQRLVRAARTAAQREVLGLGVLAALLGREDDEALWDEVMSEVMNDELAPA